MALRLLVTGSSGLIGSEVVSFFARQDWTVFGIDNNERARFFGPDGDTRWNQARLAAAHPTFEHIELDIRDRDGLMACIERVRPDLVVHAAAQPSHDLAASRPFEDFDVNAVGTLNLYGDAPNEIRLRELETRWDYDDPAFANGIAETFRIDRSKHSLFGASKLAGDIMVQEYGRYFGLKCCCLRGGCLTGPAHSGVELHGFLSYLVRTNLEERTYKVYGYKGKQVRDNIHALDVARFIACFFEKPRTAEVYNMGGGRANSCSILEAFAAVERLTGKPMRSEYVDTNREGDHICYISDLSKLRAHYPDWDVTVPLDQIFEEIVEGWRRRATS